MRKIEPVVSDDEKETRSTTRRNAIAALLSGPALAALSSKALATPAIARGAKTVVPATLERPQDNVARPPHVPSGDLRPRPPGVDYIDEEWFASGVDDTGRTYMTQVYVRRPRDPAKVSGTIIVDALHAHGIAPIYSYCSQYILRSGHGWACVASQKVALEAHVKRASPTHYAALHIEADPPAPGAPTDLTESPVNRLGAKDAMVWWAEEDRVNQASDAILAQVGAALRTKGPFESYGVKHIVLAGHSETGFVVTNYINRAHQTHRLPGGAPIYDGLMPAGFPWKPFGPRDVPLMQVICEGDIFDAQFSLRPGYEGRKYRRPDSDRPDDRYRLYEFAGAPHTGTRYPPMSNPRLWPQLFPGGPSYSGPRAALSADTPTNGVVMNSMPHNELFNMALNHLVQWVASGTVPPRAPRLKITADGRYIAKDANGNALGGVRCAQMDVPHATYHGNNVKPDGSPTWAAVGIETEFSKAKMAELYGTPANYVARFDKRLDELVAQGWFLAEDTPGMRAEAQAQTW